MDPQVFFDPAASSSSILSTTPSSRASSSADIITTSSITTTTAVVKPKRRPIPRKGHTKSRNGCLNCKRRKVKCQETLPECGHCVRIGLRCQYPPEKPSSTTLIYLSSSSPFSVSTPSPALPLQATPTFTPTDMRFFAHFLLKAYPPLPIHGAPIWQGEVAQISHHFEYLLHAMLGLAASSLSLLLSPSSSSSPSTTSSSSSPSSTQSRNTPATTTYTTPALHHRLTSIRLLNASLSQPCSSPQEGTARYATMMALTFQSSYMPDGMLDFVVMTRGCHVIASTAMDVSNEKGGGGFEAGPFGVFSREGHVDACRRLGPNSKVWEGEGEEGVLGEDVVRGMEEGLREMGGLCKGMGLEAEVLRKVEQVVRLARWDCIEAFDEVTQVYALLGEASHEEFFAFVDGENWPAQILLVYFFLVEYTVAYHAMSFIRSSFAYRTATTKLWVDNLAAKLPREYMRFIEWPVWFAASQLDLFAA
ncbi:hypothetical protein GE09DRAFT_1055998 [Coniochaeta sp. 2T2.1]|nr:hypothetical protein GE09DRAFT_1055998 [Coniochaeta sp. 2T2.1]